MEAVEKVTCKMDAIKNVEFRDLTSVLQSCNLRGVFFSGFDVWSSWPLEKNKKRTKKMIIGRRRFKFECQKKELSGELGSVTALTENQTRPALRKRVLQEVLLLQANLSWCFCVC